MQTYFPSTYVLIYLPDPADVTDAARSPLPRLNLVFSTAPTGLDARAAALKATGTTPMSGGGDPAFALGGPLIVYFTSGIV